MWESSFTPGCLMRNTSCVCTMKAFCTLPSPTLRNTSLSSMRCRWESGFIVIHGSLQIKILNIKRFAPNLEVNIYGQLMYAYTPRNTNVKHETILYIHHVYVYTYSKHIYIAICSNIPYAATSEIAMMHKCSHCFFLVCLFDMTECKWLHRTFSRKAEWGNLLNIFHVHAFTCLTFFCHLEKQTGWTPHHCTSIQTLDHSPPNKIGEENIGWETKLGG